MAWSISAFRHSRQKKNGAYQIKVKIRNTNSNFQRDFPVEYIEDGVRKKLSLSINEWESQKKVHQRIIAIAEARYLKIFKFLQTKKIKPSTKLVFELYRGKTYDLTRDLEIQKIKDLLSFELNKEQVNSFSDEELIDMSRSINDSDIIIEDVIQEDEVGNYMLLAVEEKRTKEDLNRINSIQDHLVRCDEQYSYHGYADYSKIIDVFGFYWTLKKTNRSRYLTKYDSKIVLRVAQFIFLTGASNRIEDLNFNWLNDYFLYLRDYGYLDTREIRNYTPLELYEYQSLMIKKKHNCKPYKESSFQDQIKKFKMYYKTLKKKTNYLDHIPKFDLDEFTFENLKLQDSKYTTSKTQKDHYVNVSELKLLNEFNSSNQELNLTRDLFFIQTFTSGNRSIDKDVVTIKSVKGVTYFEVKHSKTKSTNIGVESKYLKKVLQRHDNDFPKIKMSARQYNENLKKIATELNLDRKIEHVINRVNETSTEYQYLPLYECISQYYSRHTLINYLVDGGVPDSEIIKISGHVDTKILEHYKRPYTVEDKLKIFEVADNNNDVV